MILDLIEKNKNITQREMSIAIGSAVSMVNNFLDDYEQKGYIKRKYLSTKTVEYFVTKNGSERKKILNISYLNNSLKVFKSASEDIVRFLNQIIDKGFKRILLYGAGEVAEILLQTLTIERELPIDVLGIIDDDEDKQNTFLVGVPILSIESIRKLDFDGILISSYTNQHLILNKLQSINYPQNQISQFFEY